ncbi:hypothetical protein [Dyella koreensis]
MCIVLRGGDHHLIAQRLVHGAGGHMFGARNVIDHLQGRVGQG